MFPSIHISDMGKGCRNISDYITIWLVVWTPLKNISQLGWLFPIYGKIKNVPNHQPAISISIYSSSKISCSASCFHPICVPLGSLSRRCQASPALSAAFTKPAPRETRHCARDWAGFRRENPGKTLGKPLEKSWENGQSHQICVVKSWKMQLNMIFSWEVWGVSLMESGLLSKFGGAGPSGFHRKEE